MKTSPVVVTSICLMMMGAGGFALGQAPRDAGGRAEMTIRCSARDSSVCQGAQAQGESWTTVSGDGTYSRMITAGPDGRSVYEVDSVTGRSRVTLTGPGGTAPEPSASPH